MTARKSLSFNYGDSTIRFFPEYSPRRKTIQIAVEAPGEVIVTAPEGRTDDEVIQVVSQKSKWITQQLYLMKDIRFQPVLREFVNGESLLYLGRNYRLDLQLDPDLIRPVILLSNGVFTIKTKSYAPEYLRPFMIDWYKQKGLQRIKSRIRIYTIKLDVKPTEIHIKDQKKRWGSCTKDNILYFNWRCALAPTGIADYIVAHELCHLIEKSHSARFWTLLRTVMPDYDGRKKWLMDNGVKLDL